MNRLLRFQHHSALIEDWLQKTAPSLDNEQKIQLFDLTTRSLLIQANTVLSFATLLPILDRVLYSTLLRFPTMSKVEISGGKIDFENLMKEAASLDSQELTEALQFFLSEFFVIIGTLTAEQITDLLYEKLNQITLQLNSNKEA